MSTDEGKSAFWVCCGKIVVTLVLLWIGSCTMLQYVGLAKIEAAKHGVAP